MAAFGIEGRVGREEHLVGAEEVEAADDARAPAGQRGVAVEIAEAFDDRLAEHGGDVAQVLVGGARADLAPADPDARVEERDHRAEVVGDVYFGFYLRAMGRGRARTIDELRTLLSAAGFSSVRVVKTRYPVYAGMLVAEP